MKVRFGFTKHVSEVDKPIYIEGIFYEDIEVDTTKGPFYIVTEDELLPNTDKFLLDEESREKKYIITGEQLGILDIYWKKYLAKHDQVLEEHKEQKGVQLLSKFKLDEVKPSKKSLLERQTEASEQLADTVEYIVDKLDLDCDRGHIVDRVDELEGRIKALEDQLGWKYQGTTNGWAEYTTTPSNEVSEDEIMKALDDRD